MGTVSPLNAKRSWGVELLCKEEGSDETSMPNPVRLGMDLLFPRNPDKTWGKCLSILVGAIT